MSMIWKCAKTTKPKTSEEVLSQIDGKNMIVKYVEAYDGWFTMGYRMNRDPDIWCEIPKVD